jgi:two-component system chemotaxis response regulator CheV
LVEIIDVEKVLAEVAPTPEAISVGVVDVETQSKAFSLRVLTVDDSSVARKQVTRCLQTVGVEVVALNDGRRRWITCASWSMRARSRKKSS